MFRNSNNCKLHSPILSILYTTAFLNHNWGSPKFVDIFCPHPYVSLFWYKISLYLVKFVHEPGSQVCIFSDVWANAIPTLNVNAGPNIKYFLAWHLLYILSKISKLLTKHLTTVSLIAYFDHLFTNMSVMVREVVQKKWNYGFRPKLSILPKWIPKKFGFGVWPPPLGQIH